MVRGLCSNQKGKDERERSKSRPGFKDLKKNQCAFCKEIGHWKIDFLKIKDKNKGKESKTEANLTQVISTQAGTSQADDQTQTHRYSNSLLLPYYWLLR